MSTEPLGSGLFQSFHVCAISVKTSSVYALIASEPQRPCHWTFHNSQLHRQNIFAPLLLGLCPAICPSREATSAAVAARTKSSCHDATMAFLLGTFPLRVGNKGPSPNFVLTNDTCAFNVQTGQTSFPATPPSARALLVQMQLITRLLP